VTDGDPSAIVELRQYALHPGGRDVLVELFERELYESQEAVGMRLIGQFRDLDDPDRFVWLRGFPDMAARDSALRTFYSGPTWRAHRAAANATMVDSSNVLLLRPAAPAFGFALDDRVPSRGGSRDERDGAVLATIYTLRDGAGRDFPAFFEQVLGPALREAGLSLLATFETEPSANTFPELPVREQERVFIWFCRCPSSSVPHEHAAELTGRLSRPPEVLRLAPTSRSRVRA
jgi:NIPSNAP